MNFWVINCPSAYAGKQESLMMHLALFPPHISWKFLLVSQQNESVWTGLCPQMLIVKAYDAIMSKYCLVCDKHEKQEEMITNIWLHRSLTKLHCSRVIMWAQALHWLQVISIQAFITEDHPPTRRGNVLRSCAMPRVSRRKVSDVIQDCYWALLSGMVCDFIILLP